jgi:hypothetical protein
MRERRKQAVSLRKESTNTYILKWNLKTWTVRVGIELPGLGKGLVDSSI